jgi:hypothetical protein
MATKHSVVDFWVKNNPAVDAAFIKNKFVTKYGSNTNVKFRVYDKGFDPDYFHQFPGATSADTVQNIFVDVYVSNASVSNAQLTTDVTAMVASVANSTIFVVTAIN